MKHYIAAVLAVLAIGIGAQPAAASTNSGPSTAVQVAPGIPFSGDWSDTPRQHVADCCDYWHFYRPAFSLRTGDSVQLAIDNSRNSDGINACLLSPVDEFGAAEALRNECVAESAGVYVTEGALARRVLVYQRSQPNGFLVMKAFDSSQPTGQYTVTIERVITRVNIGFVPPARSGRRLAISAALRYGDNTVAADGIRAQLQARWGIRRGSQQSWTTLAGAASAGGSVKLSGRLPKASTSSRTQIRACVDQPGGSTPRCTRAYSVRITGR